MNILIVDDDARARAVLRTILERMGATTVEAHDGEMALEKLRAANYAFDVVLLDWLMPRMSGIDVARAVSEHPLGRRIPMLMVTGENDPSSVAEAFYAGVKGYIVKPFTPETVRRKVREITAPAGLDATAAIGAGGALSGRIDALGIQEVVQFIQIGRRSGILQITETGHDDAWLAFYQGEVHDAQIGSTYGESAFYEISRLTRGRFQFEARSEEPVRRITTPTVHLVIEAMRLRDEAAEQRKRERG